MGGATSGIANITSAIVTIGLAWLAVEVAIIIFKLLVKGDRGWDEFKTSGFRMAVAAGGFVLLPQIVSGLTGLFG